MSVRRRAFLIGVGDLGSRLSQLIAEHQLVKELRLAGRKHEVRAWANILSIATGCKVTFTRLDALSHDALKRELSSFEPDLILQCASLLSPWAFSRSSSPIAAKIAGNGFALQVSAQLPIVSALMQVHRELGLSCPVVNCSFPDLTHSMLSCSDLAPTIGIGNVAMIAARVKHSIRSSANAPVRVIAHHSQVSQCMREGPPDRGFLMPLVYRGNQRVVSRRWFGHSPLGFHTAVSLNYLSASTAIPLLRALLDKTARVRTHAPGPLGLPGGYPIRVSRGQIALDLPTGISTAEAMAFNLKAARLDGVSGISPEGTLTYTSELRDRVGARCRELCEPLRTNQSLERWNILKAIYDEAH